MKSQCKSNKSADNNNIASVLNATREALANPSPKNLASMFRSIGALEKNEVRALLA